MIHVQDTKVEGFYRIRKYKQATDELVQDTGNFKNVITDQGFTRWCSGGFCNRAGVGTGTATPTTSDTTLANYLAVATTVQATNFTPPVYPTTPYCDSSITYRFGAGAAAGNLTEVGVGYDSSGFKVSSRALIVDGSGNPITITVLSDEYLDVTYTMRMYVPMSTPDASYNINISGTTYAVVARAANIASWAHNIQQALTSIGSYVVTTYGTGSTLGTTATQPSGTGTSAQASATFSFTASGGVITYASNMTAPLVGGNSSGGIVCARLQYSGGSNGLASSTQFSFTPAIPKDATKILTLSFSQTISRL